MKYSDLVKKHIEKLYDGVCTIMYYEKEQGIINNTILAIKAKNKNVKCRLSYKDDNAVVQTESVAKVSRTIKLFLPPDTEIKEGCKVIVTQEGETNAFICAGKPLNYGSHKEVVLELEKRYA